MRTYFPFPLVYFRQQAALTSNRCPRLQGFQKMKKKGKESFLPWRAGSYGQSLLTPRPSSPTCSTPYSLPNCSNPSPRMLSTTTTTTTPLIICDTCMHIFVRRLDIHSGVCYGLFTSFMTFQIYQVFCKVNSASSQCVTQRMLIAYFKKNSICLKVSSKQKLKVNATKFISNVY